MNNNPENPNNFESPNRPEGSRVKALISLFANTPENGKSVKRSATVRQPESEPPRKRSSNLEDETIPAGFSRVDIEVMGANKIDVQVPGTSISIEEKFSTEEQTSETEQTSTANSSNIEENQEYSQEHNRDSNGEQMSCENEVFEELGIKKIIYENLEKVDEVTNFNYENNPECPGLSGLSDSDSDSEIFKPGECTLLVEYDEIMSEYDAALEQQQRDTEYLINFIEIQMQNHDLWQQALDENKRLRAEVDKANHDIGDFTNKLNVARKLLDKEKKMRRLAEDERNNLEKQMVLARDLLFSDQCKNHLPDDTKERLAFLNTTEHGAMNFGNRLNTICEDTNEMNSTGSLLSDLSYSRSEDDLDSIIMPSRRQWKKHIPAPIFEEPAQKRHRSSGGNIVEITPNDKVIATTTVEVPKDGPITATSVIESVPSDHNRSHREKPFRAVNKSNRDSLNRSLRQSLNNSQRLPYENQVTELNRSFRHSLNRSRRESLKEIHINNHEEKLFSPSTVENRNNVRHHTFVPKTIIKPDVCGPCGKKIKFGKVAVKCKDCRGVCHPDCKDSLPLPCIPFINTPTQKRGIGTIADYVAPISPMVPAIIIHSIKEVELRGLNEVGIYRVPGSEKEVRLLKEKFLKGKGTPVLNDTDIHVICGVIKDFLRSLQEPLITNALWKEFISATEVRTVTEVPTILYGVITKLPQPNRDTLAYLMCHLQKVSESKECKMPISNLSKVFGPTVIGYSSLDLGHDKILTETRQQAMVLEYLLEIPNEFWRTFIDVAPGRIGTMQQTPSTDSLHRDLRGFLSNPHSLLSLNSARKPRKYFGTPPKGN